MPRASRKPARKRRLKRRRATAVPRKRRKFHALAERNRRRPGKLVRRIANKR